MDKKKGQLVTFEGIDGAGKSTQVKLFTEYLKNKGRDFLFLREPTNGTWGKEIRSLLEAESNNLSPEQAFNLFTRDRRENVEKNILPALCEGRLVVMDRYYFSSIAYQGALGIDVNHIRETNEAFAPAPDLVFFLEIIPSAGLERITRGRGEKTTQYEKDDYLKEVKNVFDSLKDSCIRRIDASQSIESVHQKIVETFEEKF